MDTPNEWRNKTNVLWIDRLFYVQCQIFHAYSGQEYTELLTELLTTYEYKKNLP